MGAGIWQQQLGNLSSRHHRARDLVPLKPALFPSARIKSFPPHSGRTALMSQATAQAASSSAPAPLVALTEDEILFRDTVRQFAEETVRPHVKEMDEKGVFEHSLIDQFFQLGLMGIEVPEQYGGGGGRFFEAILGVGELSATDTSAGVVNDVQNTLVNNALLRWTTEDQKKRY